jgi:hypothetical protein
MAIIFPCAFSPWTPNIGDANLIGWSIAAFYMAVAVFCARPARAAAISLPIQRREALFWWTCALVMGFLAINKQLDLQTLVTDIGRCFAVEQGWYEDRRDVQRGFLAAVVVLGVAGVLCCWLVLRRTFARTGLAVLGLGFVCLFVIVRAASFHHVDTFLGGSMLGLRISTLLEVTGPLLILAAAVRAGRRRLG